MHCGLKGPVGIPTVFPQPLIVPCIAQAVSNLRAIVAVQGDCEMVYLTGPL